MIGAGSIATAIRDSRFRETIPMKHASLLATVCGLALLAVAIPAASEAPAAGPPPQVSAGQVPPVAHPYDVPARAHTAVDAAFEQARATNKRVLIDFGANWCPDCRMLAGVMQLSQVQPWIGRNFIAVSVNVDHFNVNMDIARRYGVTVKAIPTVLVVTPQGKLLNADGTLVLGNARTMSSQAVVDQIAAWNRRS